jgi:hypothetical protein
VFCIPHRHCFHICIPQRLNGDVFWRSCREETDGWPLNKYTATTSSRKRCENESYTQFLVHVNKLLVGCIKTALYAADSGSIRCKWIKKSGLTPELIASAGRHDSMKNSEANLGRRAPLPCRLSKCWTDINVTSIAVR